MAVAVDFSICHQASVSSRADPAIPLAKSAERAAYKIKKYGQACKDQNLDFMPVVMEATGALGQSAKDFFNILAANATVLHDEEVSVSKHAKIEQAVSIALFRSQGNKFVAATAKHRGQQCYLNEGHSPPGASRPGRAAGFHLRGSFPRRS